MKKKIVVMALVLCIASAPTVFAQRKHHGRHGGYNNKHHSRPYFHGFHGGRYYDRLGLEIALARGLFLGSPFWYSATLPPAQTIIYGAPYLTIYQQQVVAQPPVLQQPTTCVEYRIVEGQEHIKQNDGSKIWRSSRYPRIERVQVPCD